MSILILSIALTSCLAANSPPPEIEGKYDEASHLYSSKSNDFSIFLPASPPGDPKCHGIHTSLAGPESSYVYYNSKDVNYAIAKEGGFQVVGTWSADRASELIDSRLNLIVREMSGKETTTRLPVGLMGGLYMGKEASGSLPDGQVFRIRQYMKTQPNYSGFILFAAGERSGVVSAETDRFFASLTVR